MGFPLEDGAPVRSVGRVVARAGTCWGLDRSRATKQELTTANNPLFNDSEERTVRLTVDRALVAHRIRIVYTYPQCVVACFCVGVIQGIALGVGRCKTAQEPLSIREASGHMMRDDSPPPIVLLPLFIHTLGKVIKVQGANKTA